MRYWAVMTKGGKPVNNYGNILIYSTKKLAVLNNFGEPDLVEEVEITKKEEK